MNPPYTINNNILNLLASITQIVGNVEVKRNDLKLRKENRIKSIHSSLAIENNSLLLDQVTAIINGKRVLGDLKEVMEVVSAYEAYDNILTLNPYDIDDFLFAHGILTNKFVSESGKFRSKDVGIFAGEKVLHVGARPMFIKQLIEELFSWGKNDDVHDIIKSCIIHYEIENIHPFEDGNGRMGRLWQTVILSNWNPIFAWVPVETIIYKNQSEYYDVLRRSDELGDATVFIEFMLKCILTTLQEYKTTDLYEELNGEEMKVYEVINDYLTSNKYITTNLTVDLTNKSSATIRRYFAKYVEYNLIDYTGSNKNRRYFLDNNYKVD